MIMVVLQQVQSHLGMMMAESMRSVFWLDLLLGRLVVRSVVWLEPRFEVYIESHTHDGLNP